MLLPLPNLFLLAQNIFEADILNDLIVFNIGGNRTTKKMDKFDKLFDLAKFFITLSLLLLLILLFLTLIAIRIKFFNDLVDGRFKY